MKRLLIFILIALVALTLGIGGGLFVGMNFLAKPTPVNEGDRSFAPGPVVPLGGFTVNLADKEVHVLRAQVALELTSEKAGEEIAQPAWQSLLRNDVLLLLKDQRYDDLRSGEGMLELAQQIKRRLNALLPLVDKKPPVLRVLFEEFIIQ
ncbi:MAG TPA: flagellar basal body-associated FliL family protein [Synergistaceae bacterium]|nr:flagellar basal body-associated FliL family protein [Synergistaceae bacterium]HPJ26167.1 flagellar basal body-associated FliL family protein [Synergistaceae bacterium]HPQ38149.1 flagellar basal body-associated FliL family protein [Synergistaceae bacterium]